MGRESHPFVIALLLHTGNSMRHTSVQLVEPMEQLEYVNLDPVLDPYSEISPVLKCTPNLR